VLHYIGICHKNWNCSKKPLPALVDSSAVSLLTNRVQRTAHSIPYWTNQYVIGCVDIERDITHQELFSRKAPLHPQTSRRYINYLLTYLLTYRLRPTYQHQNDLTKCWCAIWTWCSSIWEYVTDKHISTLVAYFANIRSNKMWWSGFRGCVCVACQSTSNSLQGMAGYASVRDWFTRILRSCLLTQ